VCLNCPHQGTNVQLPVAAALAGFSLMISDYFIRCLSGWLQALAAFYTFSHTSQLNISVEAAGVHMSEHDWLCQQGVSQ
jgi:hypothetical protein